MQFAISYKRFSTAKQAQGDSRRRQTAMAEEYCRRHKIRLVDTYLDAGLSGFRGEHLGDNGALRALLDQAKSGKFKPGTLLIVESLDRLSRLEMTTALRLFLDILDAGLVLVTLIDGEQIFTKERVDGDPTALMFAIMILSRANNQSRTNKERALEYWRRARRKAREYKTPMGGIAPAWLSVVGRRDKRRFVVDEAKAAVVARIFELGVLGMGHERIARFLNQENVPTFRGTPRWTVGMVAGISKNRAVIGVYEPRMNMTKDGESIRMADADGPIEGYYPAIIGTALYKAYKLAAASRMHCQQKTRGNPYSNLVTRIGNCESCSGTLIHNKHMHGYDYLRCVASKAQHCSNRQGFPYHSLEPFLLVFDDLMEIAWRLLPKQPPDEALNKKIVKLEAAVGRTKARLELLPLLPGDEAVARVARLRAKLAQFEDELADAKQRVQVPDLLDPNGPLAGFKPAKIKAQSADMLERHVGRAELAAELRRLIEGVVLHGQRTLTIHAKAEHFGCLVVYALDADGLRGIQIVTPDGRAGFIGGSVFRSVLPGKKPPRRVPKHMTDEPVWDSLNVEELLARVHVVHLENGNWQALVAEPTQMDKIAWRGQHALTFRANLAAKRFSAPEAAG